MANTTYLKKGDTFPDITAILSTAAGPVDLTDASVEFRLSTSGAGSFSVARAATIATPQTGDDLGKVSAEWSTETEKLGKHRIEWRVTFPDGKVGTFPRGANTCNYVEIQPIIE